MGIPGNERVDKEAKKAVVPTAVQKHLPIIALKTTTKAVIRQTIVKEWLDPWHEGRGTASPLRNITRNETIACKATKSIYSSLWSRKDIAWIARLRTGHCSLNKYLHRIGIMDSATCDCEGEQETVDHYLLSCALYERERDVLRRQVGVMEMRTDKLLGNPSNIKHTIEYVRNTGRFTF